VVLSRLPTFISSQGSYVCGGVIFLPPPAWKPIWRAPNLLWRHFLYAAFSIPPDMRYAPWKATTLLTKAACPGARVSSPPSTVRVFSHWFVIKEPDRQEGGPVMRFCWSRPSGFGLHPSRKVSLFPSKRWDLAGFRKEKLALSFGWREWLSAGVASPSVSCSSRRRAGLGTGRVILGIRYGGPEPKGPFLW